jgi:two-component sensor histidine kinase
VEHGFPGNRAGSVRVVGKRSRGTLTVQVLDDGAGLPEKFSVDNSDRLGLQIVRTLLEAELDASLELTGRGPSQPGTAVTLRVPVNRRERARGADGAG